MIVTMLVGAMNYNNNLGVAVTFLLASLGTVTIYHCQRTLAGLQIQCLGAAPVFAGETAEVRFSLANDSREPREGLCFGWDMQDAPATSLPARSSQLVSLALPTTRRGLRPLPALFISTCAPLGLVRAWTWVHLDYCALVYPRPADASARLPPDDAPLHAGVDPRHGDDDFAGLRPLRAGDPPRRIAWKAYARNDELLVREFRGGAHEPLWIDWANVPADDPESRISCMARAVLDAHRQGRAWGMRLPGRSLQPGRGTEHLHRCLSCLAQFTAPAGVKRA